MLAFDGATANYVWTRYVKGTPEDVRSTLFGPDAGFTDYLGVRIGADLGMCVPNVPVMWRAALSAYVSTCPTGYGPTGSGDDLVKHRSID